MFKGKQFPVAIDDGEEIFEGDNAREEQVGDK